MFLIPDENVRPVFGAHRGHHLVARCAKRQLKGAELEGITTEAHRKNSTPMLLSFPSTVGCVEMSVAKLSVSIPKSLAGFVEEYRKKRGLKRSQVFEEAVKLLRARELETAYRQSGDDEAWNVTVSDGLADETW